MKKFLVLFVVSLAFFSAVSAQTVDIRVIPKPQFIERQNGVFRLSTETSFFVKNSQERVLAEFFNAELRRSFGFSIKITNDYNRTQDVIRMLGVGVDPPFPPQESYRLNIARQEINIHGTGKGSYYALQTLLQLIRRAQTGSAEVPALYISDQPRFAYRGMHLDTARHFMPVEFVKKYIDLMSQYKFNYFHWHLTEDQGWRIEIKKYPRLTEIGSKRPETVKERNLSPYIGDGIPHGGFYTQEQIKEVVAYANARFVTVIPEIELPGHASAALAAYPQFGCKADYQYKVQTTWGIFKEVYCPTEETFKFLEDVLAETIELFPDSPYIHIGGDEPISGKYLRPISKAERGNLEKGVYKS